MTDKALSYFSAARIGIKDSERELFFLGENGVISVFSDGALLCNIEAEFGATLTDNAQKRVTDNGKSIDQTLDYIRYSALCNILCVYAYLKMNLRVKKKKMGYKNQLVLKNNGVSYNIIEYNLTEDYCRIEMSDGCYKLYHNSFEKHVFKVPSDLYPMPNSGMIQVFHAGNTNEILDSSISDILGHEKFELGRCYTNVEKAYNALHRELPGLQIQYYAGWLYDPVPKGNMTHHAWLVVNKRSVIDMAKYKNNLLYVYARRELNGESTDFCIDTSVNWLREMDASDLAFKDKHGYGKVLDSSIYLGVESNRSEALSSFKNNVAVQKNHPFYKNKINETQSKYYSKEVRG